MPGKVKVKIIAGRNLPVMDRSSDTTDAYVEIKLGNTTYKTDVCRKSLNPQWNSEWYRFEVDDSELQDEPLQIRLMDHDTYSANDAIGKVYLNLNPLLIPAVGLSTKYGWTSDTTISDQPSSSVMSGWIPVYDTMHGIRGEVNVTLKVELFSDFNKFRQSSCGVQFFCSPVIPIGYHAKVIHGFVEELVVNDDPEYQWIDKIRTPRASNEARQTLFFKLSGELQRKVGVKTLDLGGNAVIGYSQCFDLEGESGIVARAIGTAVSLIKHHDIHPQQVDLGIVEERALKYLKFLAYNNELRLENNNLFEGFVLSNLYPNTSNPSSSNTLITFSPQPELHASTSDENTFRRHNKFNRQFSQPQDNLMSKLNIKTSFSTQSLSDSKELALKQLLKQEEMRGLSDNKGFSHKIRVLKHPSQFSFSKKMSALKARLSDSNMLKSEEFDSCSVNKQDDINSVRTSLIDLRDIRKRNKSKYRTNSSNNNMAELLIKSIIQAHTSLDCIHEIHDTASISTTCKVTEDNAAQASLCSNTTDSSTVDLNNSSDLIKTSSEPNLHLPDADLDGSTTSDSSSSDDEEMSENKDEKFDYDTVSLIVKNITEKVNSGLSPTTPNLEINIETTNRFLSQQNTEQKIEELTHSAVLSDIPDIEHKNNIFIFPTSSILQTEGNNLLDESNDENNFASKTTTNESDLSDTNLVTTAMQTMLLEKVKIMTPFSVQLSKESQSTSINKKTSFLKNIKSKFDSIKKSSKKQYLFNKIKHPWQILKKKEAPNLVNSAMSTILMDKVNNMKGFLISVNEQREHPKLEDEVMVEQKCSESMSSHITTIPNNSPQVIISQSESNDLIESYTEQPNVNVRLDKGVSFDADEQPNCTNNAKHAPCLYPSDRPNTDSPYLERDSSREHHGHQRTESTGGKISQSPARLSTVPCIHRRSSDSDLSITPKGNSLTGSDRSGGALPGYHHVRSALMRPTVDNFDMMEYPFLTMSKYPPGFILHLGGAVSARSVKLLERITNIEEPESRDTWWSELRMEIRSHARALNCNAVLGYTESTSICDEVCVLSASGTAAIISLHSAEMNDGISNLPVLHKLHFANKDITTSSSEKTDLDKEKIIKHSESVINNKIIQLNENQEQEISVEFSGIPNVPSASCRICHIPYNESSVSFRVTMLYCANCKLAKVPDILLTTIEIPEGAPTTGRGCFLQSYVCRPKRDLKGELNAKEISESLPFLEYELHRLLVNKMKVKGMNAIFGLKVRISIGERMLVGIATGTAVFLLPLPPPSLPKLVAGNSTTDEKKLSDMQKLLVETVKKNKEIYELKICTEQETAQNSKILSDTEESDEEKSMFDMTLGNKDSCVLEVDDSEDIEVINLLIEPRPPDGFHVVNTENVPGLEDLEIVRNLQMFTQVWRAKIPLNQPASGFGKHFHNLLQSVYFKLRRMIPCALCDLQFRVDLPEPDEIQLTLLGMALGLGDPLKVSKFKRKTYLTQKDFNKKTDDDLIFSLEEDHIPENGVPVISQTALLNTQSVKLRQKSPQRFRTNLKQRHTPIRERHGVDITPLSYVPGGKIERYLGYLNFFFIRETTSMREGGGLSGFVHSFVTEVLAIVRAHVTALGGNAMVSYFMTECVLYHNAHKNQGQCLINVGGDVVFVSYFTED